MKITFESTIKKKKKKDPVTQRSWNIPNNKRAKGPKVCE